MKRISVALLTIILVMFVLLMLCVAKTINMGQQLSKLQIDQQNFEYVSVQEACDQTSPIKLSGIDVARADTAQEQLEADIQLDFLAGTENITCPQVCISQWLHDVIAVRETLSCISHYITNTDRTGCEDSIHKN